MTSPYQAPPSGQPPPQAGYPQYIHHIPPPDEPPPAYAPPSYEDATGSPNAPLLVGAPSNYGTYRAYPEPEGSTDTESDIEDSSRGLPIWVGQLVVVITFLAIIYGFWRVITSSDYDGLD